MARPGGMMRNENRLWIVKMLRAASVAGIATVGTLTTSFLVAVSLRVSMSKGATLNDLTATTLGGTLLGLFLTFLLCLLAFHAFSFFESTTLPQAIRLNEAMQLLHAKTTKERLATLKYYNIDVFKTKEPLGDDIKENVQCKFISTFLTPWAFRSDQNAAFGSESHCCDFEQIQQIVSTNKIKWGETEEPSCDASIDTVALQRRIADLREENKQIKGQYTAASGRESKLKVRLTEVENHMAVLVELANKITNEFKPPRKAKKDEIKAKYLAIGKIYGITEAPGAYIDLFRKHMPSEIINWSGAPSQGVSEERT